MRLQDGIKLKGRPVEIPNCSRDNLPQFFADRGYRLGAEIGVYKGAFTEKFCQAGLTVYAIDPWRAYRGAGRTQNDQARQNFLYEHTKRTLTPYPNCKIIRKTSREAVEDFKAGSLDFVYIDGDHRFPAIATDIYEWYLRVRKGGVISGHDFFCTHPGANNVICHVQPVVEAFVKTYEIPHLYIFGQVKPEKRLSKDDRYLSWLFFKP